MDTLLIETIVLFKEDPESEYSKDIYARFSFLISEVSCYNETTDGTTTIALKDGHRYETFIDYCTFDEVYKANADPRTMRIVSEEGNYKYQKQTDKKL